MKKIQGFAGHKGWQEAIYNDNEYHYPAKLSNWYGEWKHFLLDWDQINLL